MNEWRDACRTSQRSALGFVGQRPSLVSLARVLVDAGLTDSAWLGRATAIANEADVPMVHALTRWRLIDPQSLASALAAATGLPLTDLSSAQGPPPVSMSRTACHRLRVLPLAVDGAVLALAMSDPTDEDTCAEVEEGTQLSVERVLVNDDDLEAALRRVYARPGDERRLTGLNALPTTSSHQSFPGVGLAVVSTPRSFTPPARFVHNAPPAGASMPTVPPLTAWSPPPPPTLAPPTEPAGDDVFEAFESTAVIDIELSQTGLAEQGIARLMSVCVVVQDDGLADEIARRLTSLVGSLAVFSIERALQEVGHRRFNMLVAVLPTVTTTTALAFNRLGLLLEHQRGVTVLSNVAGLEVVPGVAAVAALPRRSEVVDAIKALVLQRATGD
jgi:hypothetical protein